MEKEEGRIKNRDSVIDNGQDLARWVIHRRGCKGVSDIRITEDFGLVATMLCSLSPHRRGNVSCIDLSLSLSRWFLERPKSSSLIASSTAIWHWTFYARLFLVELLPSSSFRILRYSAVSTSIWTNLSMLY